MNADNRIETVEELIENLKKLDGKTRIALKCQDGGGFYSGILSGCKIKKTTIGEEDSDENNIFDDQNEKNEKIIVLF